MAQLPQEILESIIDEVKNNKDSLSAISLTCRRCYPRTRLHLFSTIQIHGGSAGSLLQLRDILDARPNLAPLIRAATILDERAFVAHTPSAAILPDTLDRLTSLERIGIKGFSDYIYWKRIPRTIMECLHKTFSRPQIRSVALEGIASFPLRILSSYRQLESLTLHEIDACAASEGMDGWPAVSEEDGIDGAAPTQLRRLDITAPSQVLNELYAPSFASPPDTSQLRELALTCYDSGDPPLPEREAMVQRVLQRCAPLLTTYEVTVIPRARAYRVTEAPECLFKHLPLLANLLHLKITVNSRYFAGADGLNLSGTIIAALTTLYTSSADHPLQTFSMSVIFASIHPGIVQIRDDMAEALRVVRALDPVALVRLDEVAVVFDCMSLRGDQLPDEWEWGAASEVLEGVQRSEWGPGRPCPDNVILRLLQPQL